MKAFVINLDRRPDRLEEISRHLTQLGIQFERIPAIDRHFLDIWSETNFTKAFLYHSLRSPLSGAVACYLSHRKIWNEIVKRDLPQAMVFEDDATPSNFDPAILKYDMQDSGIDLLRLEELDLPGHGRLGTTRFSMDILGRKAVGIPTFGCAAYIVTRAGAGKMLRASKFWFEADHFDIWERIYHVRTAVLRPNMFAQSGSKSDITTSTELRSEFKSIVLWFFNALLDIGGALPKYGMLAIALIMRQES